MTEPQLADLYHAMRIAPQIGFFLLLVEWTAGLAFWGLPFRWGIPFIRRVVSGSARSLPKARAEDPRFVLVPTSQGDWLFRFPQSFFMWSTPFPLHGQVIPRAESLLIVGRHPIGGALFFGGVVAQQALQGLAPVLAPSLAAKGIGVDFGSLAFGLAICVIFYGGSLLIERNRFLGAVDGIVALATPSK